MSGLNTFLYSKTGKCYEKIEIMKKDELISVKQLYKFTDFPFIGEAIEDLEKTTVNKEIWKNFNFKKITLKTLLTYWQCEEVRLAVETCKEEFFMCFPLPNYYENLDLSPKFKYLLQILYNLYTMPSITHLFKGYYGVTTVSFLAEKMNCTEVEVTELLNELLDKDIIRGITWDMLPNRLVFMLD